MPGSLGIVIVNYRTADLVADCLRSLEPEVAASGGARVVVVDNCSGDRSVERIAEAISAHGWGRWARLVAAASNRGFSAGNNVGIRALMSEADPPQWFFLLNPDTLVRPGALEGLLRCGRERPGAGIVGAAQECADGSEAVAAFRFHSIVSELLGTLQFGPLTRLLRRWTVALPTCGEPRRVDWVSGAAMMVRREVFEQVGLMDEGYFLYYEETDLCRRAARAGWECWTEPRSRIVHLEGKSTGVQMHEQSKPLPGYVLESRRRYFVRNHGRAYAILADLAWLLGYLGFGVQRILWPWRKERRPPRMLRDFVRNSALLPEKRRG